MLKRLLRNLCTEYLWDFVFEGVILFQIRKISDISVWTGWERDVKLCLHGLCTVEQQEVRQSHRNWICKSQISCFVLKSWTDDRVLLLKDGDIWPQGQCYFTKAMAAQWIYTFFLAENKKETESPGSSHFTEHYTTTKNKQQHTTKPQKSNSTDCNWCTLNIHVLALVIGWWLIDWNTIYIHSCLSSACYSCLVCVCSECIWWAGESDVNVRGTEEAVKLSV